MREIKFNVAGARLALAAALAVPCAPASAVAMPECGLASWYALSGNKIASGETADPDTATAAHRTLPFGTRVRVENLDTGQTATVTINDRGPHVKSRLIDVAEIAAEQLGFKDAGQTRVRISVADAPADGKVACKWVRKAGLGIGTRKSVNFR